MRLIPMEKGKMLKEQWKPSKIVEEFSRMDCDCVEVDGACQHYTSLSSAHGSFARATRAYGYKVVSCNGKLYLVKP